MNAVQNALAKARAGDRLSDVEAYALSSDAAIPDLLDAAAELTETGFGRLVTYSPKVFVPLTRLCRDVCHYCTFATTPTKLSSPYLSLDEVLEIARSGEQAGCREALFTLGDKPELRYRVAREALAAMGLHTTIDYLHEAARRVCSETGLLPHLNPGVMSQEDIARLRPYCASMGLMLESVSAALCDRGGPHYGSPDKLPARRLATIEAAGREAVPFTSGILIGIGETRADRIASLLAIRDLHDRYGHIQEVIIQNFKPKPGTPMAKSAEPSLEDQLWTLATARLVFGPTMSIQAPPNLRPGKVGLMLGAGANDLGGVSPVTPDHVNPEMPWPHLRLLSSEVERSGKILRERFAICPHHAMAADSWLDPAIAQRVRRDADASGLPRQESWFPGGPGSVPAIPAGPLLRRTAKIPSLPVRKALYTLRDGLEPSETDVVALFSAFGEDEVAVVQAADRLRAELAGDAVTFIVNRNINYTNICSFRCGFCAFAKGSPRGSRDTAYLLDPEEVAGMAEAAWQRGATEVCLQGGIHPSFTGRSYLDILAAVKSAVPGIHVHAFSPLEVMHGARSLGWSLEAFLRALADAGLGTMPGTAAEILDDEIRRLICPDKLTSSEWQDVVETAHRTGIRSTATIMFGHVDGMRHWARHLLRLRNIQRATEGFTEFVPLPYVHMEAPLWRRGLGRRGPSYRETRLMHAVSRLVFGSLLPNIQVSWVKLGQERAADCLQAGANDLGGILMNESITRAAGGHHGQEFNQARMLSVANSINRPLRQRDTLYRDAVKPAGKLERHSA